MASESTSWMPAQGKFQVTIGPSLNRALKARKQGGTPPAANPRRNLPDRDFYSFRYNFKPPAVDLTKPGTIEVKKGKEKTQVAVEHSSSQAGEAYVFAGTETQAKECDVVLIYDDETGTYTLEKLDSFVNLTWERKRTSAARAPSPDVPSPSDMDAPGDNDEDLEKELLETLDENNPVTKPTKPRLSQPPPRPPPQRKEEEEEEEILIPPVQEVGPPPPAKSQPAKSARPTKPIPKPRVSAATASAEPATLPTTIEPTPAATAKQKTAPKSKKRKGQELDRQSDPEVEVLSFGKPAKPAKRAKVPVAAAAPPPPEPQPSASLALPGSSNSGFFQPPFAPAPAAKPQRTNQQAAMPGAADEDSEGEWSEVEVANADPPTRALSYHSDEGDVGDGLFGDEGDADADDLLANELDAELGGDFLEAALTEPPSAKVPLSWDQLAAATGGFPDVEDDSDDDFSSSEDSDDD
ncbi:Ell-associated factor Eaf [Leucoagaricus sp. SymC.cos]|nr:Ell-associated factor Eaf [Leucoagaricus sp. SymC.cos]